MLSSNIYFLQLKIGYSMNEMPFVRSFLTLTTKTSTFMTSEQPLSQVWQLITWRNISHEIHKTRINIEADETHPDIPEDQI